MEVFKFNNTTLSVDKWRKLYDNNDYIEVILDEGISDRDFTSKVIDEYNKNLHKSLMRTKHIQDILETMEEEE